MQRNSLLTEYGQNYSCLLKTVCEPAAFKIIFNPKMFIQKTFRHLIVNVLEKFGFFWPLPQRKYPKVPKRLQKFYRWYRSIFRTVFPFLQIYMAFCGFYVLIKIPGKTIITYGSVFSHLAASLYAISLQHCQIRNSEKSGFIGRVFLLDSKFDGKKTARSLFSHQFSSIPSVFFCIDGLVHIFKS